MPGINFNEIHKKEIKVAGLRGTFQHYETRITDERELDLLKNAVEDKKKELDLLKNRTEVIQKELKILEDRIYNLEDNK